MDVTRSIAVILLALAGCATPSGGSPEAGAPTPGAGSSARFGGFGPITEADLQDPNVMSGSAFDVIRQLRPSFLNSRGAGGLDARPGNVLVSVDGSSLSPVAMLGTIPAIQVTEIRFLNATDAAQRFGTTTTGGPVILVTTRRR